MFRACYTFHYCYTLNVKGYMPVQNIHKKRGYEPLSSRGFSEKSIALSFPLVFLSHPKLNF